MLWKGPLGAGLLCALAAIADCITTAVLITHHATVDVELNPVARFFMSHLGLWGQVPQKILALALVTYVACLLTRDKRETAVFVLLVLSLAQTCAAAINGYQILTGT